MQTAINEFSRAVIDTIKKIPRGKIATYKQVAEVAGKPHGSRGVAWVLNSCSKKYKLPWHRVINSQGKISFGPRTDHFRLQKKFLQHEGVEVSPQGAVSLALYQWSKKPKRPRCQRREPQMFG